MKNQIRMMVAFTVLAFVGMASAAEEGWEFKATPYLWAMGMNGDIDVSLTSVPVDVKFLDAVQDLDLGGMVSMEARHGALGLLADGAYLKLSD